MVTLFWALPTIFWTGEKLPEKRSFEGFGGSEARIISPVVAEEGNFPMAFRRLLCPSCVFNIVLINTLVVSKCLVCVAIWMN